MLVIDLGSVVQQLIRTRLVAIGEPSHRQLCSRRAVILASHRTSVLLLEKHPKLDTLNYPFEVVELAVDLESPLFDVLRKHSDLRSSEITDVVILNDRYLGLTTKLPMGSIARWPQVSYYQSL